MTRLEDCLDFLLSFGARRLGGLKKMVLGNGEKGYLGTEVASVVVEQCQPGTSGKPGTFKPLNF